jgi:hypothetical protein
MRTDALTSIFTRPADCSTSFTYEAERFNSVPGGLLIQNAMETDWDVTCFPTSFVGYGRVTATQVYSPGACPQSYYPAVSTQDGKGAVTQVCCTT